MGVFDNISNNNKSPSPAQPQGGGAFDGIVTPGKVPAAKTTPTKSTFDAVVPKAAPAVSSPYFYSKNPDGSTIGRADELDVSGKPFLAYRNSGDTATTTDKTRMATTFDPRTPQKLELKSFLTARMPDGAASQLKKTMGGSYSDELDHSIALELAGSNDKSNLKIQKGRQDGPARVSDTVENKLARDVVNGNKSLFDAQTELAQQKGLPTPWVGQTNHPANGPITNIGKDVSMKTESSTPAIAEKPAPMGDNPGGLFTEPTGKFAEKTYNQFIYALPENLPFVGPIVKFLRTPAGEEAAKDLTPGDFGPGSVEAGKGIARQAISPVITAAGIPKQVMGGDGSISLNIPGLGKVDNVQSRVIDRVVNGGESPVKVALTEGTGEVFNTLFLLGMFKSFTSPRSSVVTTAPAPEGLTVAEAPKPFREYQPPQFTQPLTTDFVEKMSQQGVDLGPKYDPALPTFFRMRGTANGNVVGEVVQIKPSYASQVMDFFKSSDTPNPNTPVVWKPTMDQPEANNFTKDSQLKITVYHGADESTAAKIKDTGFQPSKDFPGNGAVSFSSTEDGAANYSKLNGKGEVMPAKIDAQNVKTFATTDEYENAIEAQPGVTAGEKEQSLLKNYDAVVIKDGLAKGSDEILVPDPKKAVVISSSNPLSKIPENEIIPLFAKTVNQKDMESATPTQQNNADQFNGYPDLTTSILNKLQGRTSVSKQFISDLTNSPELKQTERDIIRQVLTDYPDASTVPVKEFSDKVKAELLPLQRQPIDNPRYEDIALPEESRGDVADYSEHIYQSPIKTSAGDIHFRDEKNPGYFGHTRIDDMNDGDTRRVIEVQSDLYQKGNLEKEGRDPVDAKFFEDRGEEPKGTTEKAIARQDELSKLKQYNDPSAHFRMAREEIKQAAVDGKTKLQFPTGETAMKIEGLGTNTLWVDPKTPDTRLSPEQLKIGKEIVESNHHAGDIGETLGNRWIITDVLSDGKFKAVPKKTYEETIKAFPNADHTAAFNRHAETFDISGKIDTNNPIYKFYEKTLGRYLQRFGAQTITDAKGVTWNQIPITKEMASQPVTAFKYKPLTSGPKAAKAEIQALIKKMLPGMDVKIVFDKNLLSETGALGQYKTYQDLFSGEIKQVIKLYEAGGKSPVRVAMHEAYHALENAMPASIRTQLDKETLAEMSAKDKQYYANQGYTSEKEQASEFRADEWGKAQADQAGYKSRIQKILDKVNAFIQKIIDSAKALFERIKQTPGKQGGYLDLFGEEGAGEIRPDYSEVEKGNKELNKELRKEAPGPTFEHDKVITELEQQKASLGEKLLNDPARNLLKYKGANGLGEVTGSGGVWQSMGDQKAMDLGFSSSEAARRAFDKFMQDRARFKDISQQLSEARGARANLVKEDKDAKSLNYLLNKNASKTDIDIARQERILALQKAEKETAARLQQEEKERTTLQEKINQVHVEYSGHRGLMKKVMAAFSPSKHLDKVSKPIIEKWFQKTIDAKQSGLEAFDWAIEQGPQNFQEIVDFQAGKQTSYIKQWFDDAGTDFKRRGLSFGWRDNYMPDVWKDSTKRQAEARRQYMKTKGMTDEEISNYIKGEPLPEDKALRLKLRPNFSKERFWPDYVTGMAHGLTPKFQMPADLIGYYKEAGERAVANIELIRELKSQARLLPSDEAPDSWEPVTLRFSKEGLYAPPPLAELLNGKFRDEGNLKIYQAVPKAFATVSRFLQDLVLSGGVPFTNINAFSAAQAYRLAAIAIGDVASLKFKTTLSNLKIGLAFIRSNSNALSAEWFKEKSGTLAMMAHNGIDLTDRIGGRGYETLRQGIANALRTEPGIKGKSKGIYHVSKLLFEKAISEKTFKSLMPQIKVLVFEGAYKEALRRGLEPELAEQFAAEVTKAAEGITPETGRGNTTKDSLSSVLFAPPYREGLVNIYTNAGKGFSTDFSDPTYSRNRSFIIGLAVIYLLYNIINKKLNGNYLWDNPPGRELALRIPRPNGDVFYIELGPGLLTVPRNLFTGTAALVKGDTDTAKQKYGTVLSMPLQITAQVWANKDYFGNPIWSKTDTSGTILKKIGAYVGLETSHPYVSQIYKYVVGKQPLYWSLINMAEIPVKLSSLAKEQSSKYYDKLQQKQLDQARAKEKIMPIYQKNQDLKNSGQGDKATEIYNNLNKADKAIYDLIKKDAKLKDTNHRKAVMQGVFDNLQKMKDEGRTDEANKIYAGLSPEDQHAYDLIKKAAAKSAKPQ